MRPLLTTCYLLLWIHCALSQDLQVLAFGSARNFMGNIEAGIINAAQKNHSQSLGFLDDGHKPSKSAVLFPTNDTCKSTQNQQSVFVIGFKDFKELYNLHAHRKNKF